MNYASEGEGAQPEAARECPWCNEIVRVRKDGALVAHKWEVGWDPDRDAPTWAPCVGVGTTEADVQEAMR